MRSTIAVLTLVAPLAVFAVSGHAQDPTPVSIDIMPRDENNSVNIAKVPKLDVAILSSSTFKPPNDVDYRSILFAGAGPFLSAIGTNTAVLSPFCVENDVNGDGVFDLVCKFETAELQIKQGSQSVRLTARLNDGTPISGEGMIHVVSN